MHLAEKQREQNIRNRKSDIRNHQALFYIQVQADLFLGLGNFP